MVVMRIRVPLCSKTLTDVCYHAMQHEQQHKKTNADGTELDWTGPGPRLTFPAGESLPKTFVISDRSSHMVQCPPNP